MSVSGAGVCRACLSGAGRMCPVEDRRLVALYETLTNAKLCAGDGRPAALCGACLAQLGRARAFADTALRADRLLRQLISSNSKITPATVAGLAAADTRGLAVSVHTQTQTPASLDGDHLTVKEETTEQLEITKREGTDTEDVHQHIKKENGSEACYSCDDCRLEFATKRSLTAHRRTHRAPLGERGGARCAECCKQFASASSLRVHASVHSGARPHACRLCGRTFRQKPYLQNHMRMHARKPHFCTECSVGFARADALRRHAARHATPRPFGCDRCSMTFMYKSALERHARTHSGARPFACAKCRGTFASRGGLLAHARTHTGAKPYKCATCGAAFSHAGNLRRHAFTHSAHGAHGERGQTGDERFSDESDLKTLVDAGDKAPAGPEGGAAEPRPRHRPACPQCGLTLASNSHLTVHMRTHTGEKPFACDVCQNTFKSKSTLKSHLRTHTGEKVCSCEVCGVAFTQTGSLGKHMVLHSGALPYACAKCPKAYKQSGQLTAHVRNVHEGIKKFSCEACGARFTARSHLKRHENAHAGLKPYSCFKCTHRFSTRSILKRHMKNSCK